MALVKRLVSRRTLLALEKCLSTETKETDPKKVENEEYKKSKRERYRTNPILSKTAFLFSAEPKTEKKILHLKSLRRERFSTVALSEDKETKKCEWCGTTAEKDEHFCEYCDKLLPIDCRVDLFGVFKMEPKFDVDLKELETRYKNAQMKLHPDRYVKRDQREQELATSQSSIVNKAYNKLKSPLERARYLLSLRGFETEGERTISDPGFLMEMLEAQEKIEEAQSRQEVLDIVKQIAERKMKLEEGLKEIFSSEEYLKAEDIVTELTYLERILKLARDKF